MRVGVIGSGNMGRAVGVRLSQRGHEVFFGARRPGQAEAAAALAHDARSGTNEEAADFGEVLLWTMRVTDPTQVLADPSLLDGKVVIDLNNRDYANEVATGAWFDEAISEGLQRNAPQARIVKAFNTVAMEAFDIDADDLKAVGAQTFIAGRDPEAKALVGQLAAELGFQAVDMGEGPSGLRAAEALGDIIRLLMIDGAHGPQAHLRLIDLPRPTLQAIGERQTSSYE